MIRTDVDESTRSGALAGDVGASTAAAARRADVTRRGRECVTRPRHAARQIPRPGCASAAAAEPWHAS